MFFALLACVTAESFPRMYADEVCDWGVRCEMGGYSNDAGCVREIVPDAERDFTSCTDEFDADLASACLDAIRDTPADARSCATPWPACEALYCG